MRLDDCDVEYETVPTADLVHSADLSSATRRQLIQSRPDPCHPGCTLLL